MARFNKRILLWILIACNARDHGIRRVIGKDGCLFPGILQHVSNRSCTYCRSDWRRIVTCAFFVMLHELNEMWTRRGNGSDDRSRQCPFVHRSVFLRLSSTISSCQNVVKLSSYCTYINSTLLSQGTQKRRCSVSVGLELLRLQKDDIR
jgi:hypothetical protein